MRRLSKPLAMAVTGALLFAGPGWAQTMDHSMHGMDHSGHGMEQEPEAQPEHQPQDHQDHRDHQDHQDHQDDRADSQGATSPSGTDAAPGSAPPPPVSHDRAADRYFGAEAMAAAEAAMMAGHGAAARYSKVAFDLAEYQFQDGKDGYRWEAEAWFGDLDRLVIKSKGEGVFGEGLDHGEAQVLYAKALDPWWNLQAGVRQDLAPGPVRTHATLGVEGRAPYQFEVQAALFLSHRAELTARVEGSYDQRITQRLILQPRAELDLSAQDIADYHLGSGLTSAELGLRLRYEIRREFAPYLGVSWTRAIGETADMARAGGEPVSSTSFVVGLKSWF